MASTYLQRSASGTQSNQKIWTHSGWYKRNGLGTSQLFMHETASSHTQKWEHKFNSDDYFYYGWWDGTNEYAGRTNSKYKDTNGWFHVVVRMDTTQSTADDRLRIYINGEQLTDWNFKNNPAQNAQLNLAQHPMVYGRYQAASPSAYFDGLMSHIHFCDGYSYAPTEFGETDSTTGEWKIKTDVSVSYGNLGHFILKDGNSVTDQSGNGNNFTVSGGTLTKTEDNPSNVFATMNPLDNYYASSDFSEGNNTVDMNDSGNETYNTSTLGATAGKYYAEVKLIDSSAKPMIGVVANNAVAVGTVLGNTGHGYAYMGEDGKYKTNSTNTTYGTTYTTNDIISIALDLDNNKLYFAKNGTWQNSGVPTSGSTGTGAISITAPSSTTTGAYFFAAGKRHCDNNKVSWNFGNGYFGTTAISSEGTNASGIGIFEYNVPTGYTALSTKGLNE